MTKTETDRNLSSGLGQKQNVKYVKPIIEILQSKILIESL